MRMAKFTSCSRVPHRRMSTTASLSPLCAMPACLATFRMNSRSRSGVVIGLLLEVLDARLQHGAQLLSQVRFLAHALQLLRFHGLDVRPCEEDAQASQLAIHVVVIANDATLIGGLWHVGVSPVCNTYGSSTTSVGCANHSGS